MKIVCDACRAKYFVPDEKVQKAVVRLTCQKCGNAIVVRRDQAQEQADADALRGQLEAATSKKDKKGEGWYYSRDGQSFGPFPLEELEGRFENGELGPECYVWTKSLGAWKPAHSVAPFDSHIKALKAAAKAPRNPLQDLPTEVGNASEVEKTNVRPSPRVQALREALDSADDEDDFFDPADDEDVQSITEFVDLDSEPSGPIDSDILAAAIDDGPPEMAPIDLDSMDSMDEAVDLDEDLVSMDQSVVDLDQDLTSMDGAVYTGDLAEDLAIDLDAKDFATDPDDQWVESDITGPPPDLLAADAASRSEDQAPVEKSMMIHISHLKQQNRRVRLYAVLVAVALALLGVVLLAYEYYVDRDLEGEARWTPSAALEGDTGEVIDDADFERMAPIDDFSIVDWGDEEGELVAMADVGPGDQQAEADHQAADVPSDTESESRRRRRRSESNPDSASGTHAEPAESVKPPEAEGGKEPERRRRRRASEAQAKASDSEASKPQDEEEKPSFQIKKPGSQAVSTGTFGRQRRASASVDVYDGTFDKPTDTKGSKYAKAKGRKVKSSERSQFRAGLKKVSRSVQECHKRQLKSGSLGIPKVYLNITVEPDGSVSRAKLDGSVRDSIFEKCMLSKQDRWSFESFEGKAVDLRQGFVLE